MSLSFFSYSTSTLSILNQFGWKFSAYFYCLLFSIYFQCNKALIQGVQVPVGPYGRDHISSCLSIKSIQRGLLAFSNARFLFTAVVVRLINFVKIIQKNSTRGFTLKLLTKSKNTGILIYNYEE